MLGKHPAAIAILLLGLVLCAPAHAEVGEVRFARQLGLGYLQFYVMQERGLVEKHAQAAGLGKVTTQWSPLGTPTSITDALLSGNVDMVGIGLPGFLTMWDKTGGTSTSRAWWR